MDKESELVAAKIESGEYFRDGLSWFHSKFTGPRTEFSYVLLLCALTLIALFIAILAFAEIFPLSPGANFYMQRAVEPGEYITIKSVPGDKTKPNAALINFLLGEYVRAHEEYHVDNIDRDTRYVYSFSDKPTYQQFLDFLSTDNPQSPLMVYGQQATKDVKVYDVKLFDAKGQPANEDNAVRAEVRFEVSLFFVGATTGEPSEYLADIAFQYKQIKVDQSSGAISQKPELMVTGYTTKEIKPTK